MNADFIVIPLLVDIEKRREDPYRNLLSFFCVIEIKQSEYFMF